MKVASEQESVKRITSINIQSPAPYMREINRYREQWLLQVIHLLFKTLKTNDSRIAE